MDSYKLIGCVDFSALNQGGITLTQELVNWYVREKIIEIMNLMRKSGATGKIIVNRTNPDHIELVSQNDYRACVKVQRNV